MSAKDSTLMNLVLYRVKPGSEAAFLPILKSHGPVLEKSGLVVGPVKSWQAKDIRSGRVCYVEMIPWKDHQAPELAHQLPEVMKIWEPMTPLLETLELLNLDALPG